MIFFETEYPKYGVVTEVATVETVGKLKEYHMILHVTDTSGNFSEQLHSIVIVLKKILSGKSKEQIIPVFARCFLSDISNQQKDVSTKLASFLNCAVSFIKQPLLDGSKLALWVYFQSEVTVGNDGLCYFEHNGYRQYYTSEYCSDESTLKISAYEQTHHLFESYERKLIDRGCLIERNCIRTWLFVRDIDVNYAEVVKARKKNFIQNGLRNDTHYIASTGIEGNCENPSAKILLDTMTIKGVEKGQINYLYAKRYLSSTSEYGVTFERGVTIDFGDRRNIYISGTASINKKGLIVYPDNIEKQILRMWKNVDALLKEADSTFEDLMLIIVYLRDIADYQIVKNMFDEKFTKTPKLIVLASICRPGWLVEMECIASKPIVNTKFRNF
ncbi:MAG: Rid family hydrolase [Paludibacteraceae bacterium]